MQNSFTINIPSIPSKRIKFKIQDVKQQGFGSQKIRFLQDKTYLTKKFIDSFQNFKSQTKVNLPDQDCITKASYSQSQTKCNQKEAEFRYLIPDYRKNLMIKYEKQIKNYIPPIQGQSKFNKGYSFCKSKLKDSLQYQLEMHNNKADKFTQNYYFNPQEYEQEQSQKKDQIKKSERPNAVFKNQDRWKHFQRFISQKSKPGPGDYNIVGNLNIQQKPKFPNIERQNPQNQIKSLNEVKSKLQKLVKRQEIRQLKNYSFSEKSHEQSDFREKQLKQSSMFVQNQHDRFGKIIFPIANKVNIPGPGSYNFKDSIEDQAKKILILEQQRKLLRDWFSN